MPAITAELRKPNPDHSKNQNYEWWWRGVSGEADGQTDLQVLGSLAPMLAGCFIQLLVVPVSGNISSLAIEVMPTLIDYRNKSAAIIGQSAMGTPLVLASHASGSKTFHPSDSTHYAEWWAAQAIRPEISVVSALASTFDVCIIQSPLAANPIGFRRTA